MTVGTKLNTGRPRALRVAGTILVGVTLAALSMACTIFGPRPTTSTVPRDTTKTHDLAIARVTFDPKPEKTDDMGNYVDYIFGGMDRLTVTATIVNRGTAEEQRVPVTARLYQTRSGGLPKETTDHLAGENQSTVDVKPGDSRQVRFVFTGMSKYAQSTHMLMHVSIERVAGDTKPDDNVSRTYFWSLLGE